MQSFQTVPEQTRILPGARTIRLDAPNTNAAILVLHGYTGFVSDMSDLAHVLHAKGFTTLVPRLPGHGTNNHDFRATDAGDWWRTAVDSYLELAAEYEDVMVAGLSMGGLLSIMLAARFPVKKIALLAPALDVTDRRVAWTPLFRYLLPPFRKSAREEEENPERQYLAQEYWNWNWPRQTAELYRLIREARRALRRVTCPTLTVVSRKDQTVPLEVTQRIERQIGAKETKTVILEESGHVLTTGPESDLVSRSVLDWFLR